ncbi:MAG: hypothetical protein D6701_12165 [Gemmatimonadetes bacterium]|nr:MAG: hypothetical protein D6701_12165 [Gemmatimonadota bacterium]
MSVRAFAPRPRAAARRCLTGLAAFAAVGALAACGGKAPDTEGTRLSTAAAEILESDAVNASRASGAGVPPLLQGPGRPPEGREVDIATLGFDHGAEAAPVTILEFSDFGCTYCRKFHLEAFDELKHEYMDQGTVLWKQVPFILGNWANSVPASLAAECALEQGAFEPMSDLLFQRQNDWKRGARPEPILREFAQQIGLDLDRYDGCMSSDRHLWRLQAHTALARQIGVRSTPTFVVVGYAPIQGYLPVDLFRQVIDTVLVEEARRAEAGG